MGFHLSFDDSVCSFETSFVVCVMGFGSWVQCVRAFGTRAVPKKTLGQHFLHDEGVLKKIVRVASISFHLVCYVFFMIHSTR